MKDTSVIMYILVRNDMASMTPGRACAQAAHAANECIKVVKEDFEIDHMIEQWEAEAGCFGTTIVLAASIDQIYYIFNSLDDESENWTAGITYDPEYAVRDGNTVHLVDVETCMWMFGYKDAIKPLVEHLNLY